ncbi:MAG: hypothetical protein JW384_02986 [Nitrosomonadaceae bacterium]|nr:hypothetical protein [Nitrosomonadaceae bacterium]
MNKEPKTLIDLILHLDDQSEQSLVNIVKSQEVLAQDFLAATRHPYNEFSSAIKDALSAPVTRRLIDRGFGSRNLEHIVGCIDFYPNRRKHLELLVESLYPFPDELSRLLLSRPSILDHGSGEVRGLAWVLLQKALRQSRKALGSDSVMIGGHLVDRLLGILHQGQLDDAGSCLDCLSDFWSPSLISQLDQGLARTVSTISHHLTVNTDNGDLVGRLIALDRVVETVLDLVHNPSDELIDAAFRIFDQEFPRDTELKKELRNSIKHIAVRILDKTEDSHFEERMERWPGSTQVNRSIDLFGSLFYAKQGRHVNRCADTFKELMTHMTLEREVKFWANQSKGKLAQGALSHIGVDRTSLDSLFSSSSFAQIVREVWSQPPRPHDLGYEPPQPPDRPVKQ